jgi:hypothetical protein
MDTVWRRAEVNSWICAPCARFGRVGEVGVAQVQATSGNIKRGRITLLRRASLPVRRNSGDHSAVGGVLPVDGHSIDDNLHRVPLRRPLLSFGHNFYPPASAFSAAFELVSGVNLTSDGRFTPIIDQWRHVVEM